MDQSKIEAAAKRAAKKLYGPTEHFEKILLNQTELLRRACIYAEYEAERKHCEPWSIVGLVFGHGSGVASAIYEVYRSKNDEVT